VKHLSQVWNARLKEELETEADFAGEDWGYLSSYLWKYELPSGQLFLYNLLTGSIDLLSAEETQVFTQFAVHSGTEAALESAFRKELTRRGHLRKDNQSEQRAAQGLIDDLSHQAYQRPIMFFLCLTHACPIGCRHCFELDVPKNNQVETMSPKKLQVAFDRMETFRRESGRGGNVINLFGGEPFLPSTLGNVRAALELAHRNGYRLTTFSSGVFLEPFLPTLKEYASNFDWFSITLDGSQEFHNLRRLLPNAFQRTAANIDRLLDLGMPIILRVNLDRENIDHLGQFVNEFKQRGWIGLPNLRIQISPVTDHHCVRTDKIVLDEASLVIKLETLRDQFPETRTLLDRGCYFCLEFLAVSLGFREPNSLDYAPPGPRVHLCMSNNHSAFLFGADNLLYTCDEVVGNAKYASGRYYPDYEMFPQSPWQDLIAPDVPKCRQCRFLFLCGGGCTLAAIARNGRPDLPDCPQVNDFLIRYVQMHENELMRM
jgi:uncharacterized protein